MSKLPQTFVDAALGRLSVIVPLLVAAACAPPPLMCTSPVDCPAKANCAAGRCVAAGATPAINTARRLVFAPRDVGYIRPGGEGRAPAVARLGGGDGAKLFLRFDATLPAQAKVFEAYVVMQRESGAEDDPGAVALHAARIVDPWSGADVSWAHQPRIVDIGAPTTRVVSSSLASSAFVRLDVRDLVSRWRGREREDFGVAILAEGNTGMGIGFALLPSVPAETEQDRNAPLLALGRGTDETDWGEILASSEPSVRSSWSLVQAGPREPSGPALELYVK